MTNYIEKALKTEPQSYFSSKERLNSTKKIRQLHAAMGLSTEANEILDAMKKHIFYGKGLDPVSLKEEIGDLFWYLAILSDTLGISFNDAQEANLRKLKLRYKGKFTEKLAIVRDTRKEYDELKK